MFDPIVKCLPRPHSSWLENVKYSFATVKEHKAKVVERTLLIGVFSKAPVLAVVHVRTSPLLVEHIEKVFTF